MNKLKIIILFGVISIFLFNAWKEYIPESSLVGFYGDYSPTLENEKLGESHSNTLFLYNNGKYESKGWGSGEFSTTSKMLGVDRLVLFEFREIDTTRYEFPVTKELNGDVKFLLNFSSSLYLKRIK